MNKFAWLLCRIFQPSWLLSLSRPLDVSHDFITNAQFDNDHLCKPVMKIWVARLHLMIQQLLQSMFIKWLEKLYYHRDTYSFLPRANNGTKLNPTCARRDSAANRRAPVVLAPPSSQRRYEKCVATLPTTNASHAPAQTAGGIFATSISYWLSENLPASMTPEESFGSGVIENRWGFCFYFP